MAIDINTFTTFALVFIVSSEKAFVVSHYGHNQRVSAGISLRMPKISTYLHLFN